MAHTPTISLQWLKEAAGALQMSEEEVGSRWKHFADSIDVLEPQHFFRDLNEHLKETPFLSGFRMCADDLYVYSRVRLCPGWGRVITNRNRPPYLSRWYLHINSFFSNGDKALIIEKVHFDLRLHRAIEANDMDLARRLLKVVNLKERNPQERGMMAIHVAAFTGNQAALEMLLAQGIPVDSLDSEGMTPLFYAAHKGRLDMLRYLLARGASASHVEFQGRTALYWAANAGKTEVLRLLMDHGCDPNAKTRLGRSALSKAAWSAQIEAVKVLCEAPTVQLDERDSRGRCPLHTAVWGESGGRTGKKMAFGNTSDSPECAEVLILHMKRRGITIDFPDNDGNTPLCIAASTNAPKSIQLLLAHGADPNYRNHFNNTALHEAIRGGHPKCVTVLIEAGVDPNAIGFEGRSPLHKTVFFGRIAICRYLLSLPNIEVPPSVVTYCVECRQSVILKLILEKFTGVLPSDLLLKAVETRDREVFATVFERLHSEVTCAVVSAAALSDTATFAQILEKAQSVPQGCFLAAARNPDLQNLKLLLEKADIGEDAFFEVLQSAPEPACAVALDHCPELWSAVCKSTLMTPLHHACFRGFSVLADRLLQLSGEQCCPYIAQKDANSLTAHTLAAINRHLSIAAYLEDLYLKGTQKPLETKVVQLTYADVSDCERQENPFPEDQYPDSYPRLQVSWLPLEAATVHFIDTPEGVALLNDASAQWQAVGVDLEYFSFDQRRGVVALLQLSDGRTDYVLDTLKCPEEIGVFIRALMGRRECVKVLHGADSDLIWLQTDFRAFAINVFDTARAYKALTKETDLPSLARLLQLYLSLQVDKSFQVADWRIRPLPKPMLTYARTDAHFLVPLYTLLTAQMEDSHLQRTANLCTKLCRKPVSARHQRVKVSVSR